MVVTITYKLVLVVIGLGVLIFGRGFLHRYLEEILPVFYLGVLLNVFCVGLMTVLVFHPALAEQILKIGMKWLERLHFLRHREERVKKLEDAMQVYRETAGYLKEHKKVIVHVVLITFVQRFALFAVTWMVYLGFGMEGTPIWDVVLLQAASRRDGDQRGSVFKDICARFPVSAAARHGFFQRTGILQSAFDQCVFYGGGAALLQPEAAGLTAQKMGMGI